MMRNKTKEEGRVLIQRTEKPEDASEYITPGIRRNAPRSVITDEMSRHLTHVNANRGVGC